MWEKNLNQRLMLIGLVIVAACFVLFRYDSEQGVRLNLRPGLDIAGGVAMIFEIQEDEDEQNYNLADQMVQLLKKRVDPKGVYDLDWKVLSRNRIEVQMPLPPAENADLKAAYTEAEEELFASIIKNSDLEAALYASDRDSELDRLARGDADRRAMLDTLAEKWDAYQALEAEYAATAASQPSDERARKLALRDAREAVEDAKDRVRATNIQPARFQAVLETEINTETRKQEIAQIKAEFPQLADKIEKAIAAHDAWRGKRAFLEGPNDLRRLLSGAGVLEFRILAPAGEQYRSRNDFFRQQLEEIGPQPQAGDEAQWFKIDNAVSFMNLRSSSELKNINPLDMERQQNAVIGKRGQDWYVLALVGSENGLLVERGPDAQRWKLKSARIDRDGQGRRCVAFGLDPIGAARFGKLTGDNQGNQLSIFIDDKSYSHATIQSKISNQGIITGDFSLEKLDYLVKTMQAGVLPAKLKDTPLSEITIGSSLGASNLRRAMFAGIAGLVVVGVIMIVYYLTAGAIANVALILNVLLVLAAMAMLGARITLAGIAGIILTIGMTVDANVLIFERMREERERGSTLRMIIKNGYDKAFSTIIDANITTLLTCVIIYKVGSEEIKGFGLTLGWGIVTSLFTALFVTRTIFTLLIKQKIIKGINMMHLVGVPTIDWYAKRRMFAIMSVALITVGGGALYLEGERVLDVEFLGGTNVELELKPDVKTKYNDIEIASALQRVGDQITGWQQELDATQVAAGTNTLTASAQNIPAPVLAALIAEPLESADMIEKDGVALSNDGASVLIRPAENRTGSELQTFVQRLASRDDGGRIARSNIGKVIETDSPENEGLLWNLTTTTTNTQLLQYSLIEAFGDDLQRRPRVTYSFEGDNGLPYPITERRMEGVIPGLPRGVTADLGDYVGGAALRFSGLQPPQDLKVLRQRLTNMRLQPDYADLPWRQFELIGIQKAPGSEELYTDVALVVADTQIRYGDNEAVWAEMLASRELGVALAALDTEQSFRRVTQFKPQIASQSVTQASLALILSWLVIIAYLWIRFGRPMYGVAGVVALVHDVLIALAFMGFIFFVAKTPIGPLLLAEAFTIDMTVIAAFLTIIGYSINDTIVVFDRIRETRGRLGVVSPEVVNRSINQCLSRTIMTSVTTLAVLLVMYIFGGTSIRGFNYCMMVGIVTGTYSSIAVAAPLLMVGIARQKRRGPAGRPALQQ